MTDKLVKELVIARLEEMPESHKLSVGSKGSFTKEQLIEEVKQDSDVGKMIMKIHLDFLRSFKKGEFYRELGAVA